MKYLSWIFTIALALFVLWKRIPEFSKNISAEGQIFPKLNLAHLDGSPVLLPDSSADATAVLFWTRTCGPCKFEMERIQRSVDNRRIPANRVVAVHIGGVASEINSHMQKFKFTFKAVIDPEGIASSTLGVTMTPTMYLISKSGTVAWASTGIGPTDIFRIERHFQNN